MQGTGDHGTRGAHARSRVCIRAPEREELSTKSKQLQNKVRKFFAEKAPSMRVILNIV